jgi:hypothetical protein
VNWVTVWSHQRDIFIIYYIQYVGELPRSESANLYKTIINKVVAKWLNRRILKNSEDGRKDSEDGRKATFVLNY